MSSPVQTILASASALRAAQQMRAERLQHLVVVSDHERVCGIVSDRDLRSAQPSSLLVPEPEMRDKALGVIKVRDLMAPDPFVVRASDPVERVLNAMLSRRIGCVPVVNDEGDPAGIVTGGDILQLALRLMGEGEG